MEFKKAQKIVDNWIKEHGVRYFDELTNMAQLTEEVGEVARRGTCRCYLCCIVLGQSDRY